MPGPTISIGTGNITTVADASNLYLDTSTDNFSISTGNGWRPVTADAPNPVSVTCRYCGRVWREGARGWDGVTCWDGWQGCGASSWVQDDEEKTVAETYHASPRYHVEAGNDITYGEAWNELEMAIDATKAEIGAAFLPALKTITDGIASLL